MLMLGSAEHVNGRVQCCVWQGHAWQWRKPCHVHSYIFTSWTCQAPSQGLCLQGKCRLQCCTSQTSSHHSPHLHWTTTHSQINGRLQCTHSAINSSPCMCFILPSSLDTLMLEKDTRGNSCKLTWDESENILPTLIQHFKTAFYVVGVFLLSFMCDIPLRCWAEFKQNFFDDSAHLGSNLVVANKMISSWLRVLIFTARKFNSSPSAMCIWTNK